MAPTSKSSDSPDRQARIAAIRREIAAGSYETPEKLDRAVDALLERLNSGELPPPKPRPK